MSKVYVVWDMTGYDYDGDVYAAFEDEGSANKLAEIVRGRVKEVEVNPVMDRLGSNERPWRVRVNHAGKCTNSEASDDFKSPVHHKIEKRGDKSGKGILDVRVWATNKASAIALAQGLRSDLISKGEWQ